MFFFFKQKTAYEMRISDWSSDVCSSDLWIVSRNAHARRHSQGRRPWRMVRSHPVRRSSSACPRLQPGADRRQAAHDNRRDRSSRVHECPARGPSLSPRSEEHTSELQSLMRISYAVFCLKKKNTKKSNKRKR